MTRVTLSNRTSYSLVDPPASSLFHVIIQSPSSSLIPTFSRSLLCTNDRPPHGSKVLGIRSSAAKASCSYFNSGRSRKRGLQLTSSGCFTFSLVHDSLTAVITAPSKRFPFPDPHLHHPVASLSTFTAMSGLTQGPTYSCPWLPCSTTSRTANFKEKRGG